MSANVKSKQLTLFFKVLAKPVPLIQLIATSNGTSDASIAPVSHAPSSPPTPASEIIDVDTIPDSPTPLQTPFCLISYIYSLPTSLKIAGPDDVLAHFAVDPRVDDILEALHVLEIHGYPITPKKCLGDEKYG